MIATVGVVFLWLPGLNRLRHQAAAELRAKSLGKSPVEAVGDYYASTLLEPHNQAAILTLADMQLSIGDQGGAGETLMRVPGQMRANRLAEVKLRQEDYAASAEIARDGLANYGPSFDLSRLLAKAELEQSHVSQTLAAIRQSLALQPEDVGAQTIYGLAGVLSLRQGSGNSDTTNPVTAPEAVRRVARAAQDNVALAQELYAMGLLSASQAVLAKLPPASTEILKLKVQIVLSRAAPSRDDLAKAAGDMNTAQRINPSDASLWQLAIAVNNRLGDTAAVSNAQSHLTRLKAGRP